MRNIFRQLDQIRLPILSLIAGCLVACSLEFPLPVIVLKDTTIAYPCQTRGCGCQNADQCWKSCCCFSDVEKLAWAKANGITPPDWFLEKIAAAEDQAEKTPVAAKAPAAKKSSCGCCCKCESKSGSAVTDRAPDESNNSEVHLTLRQQRGCNGQLDYQLQHLVYLPLEMPVKTTQEGVPYCATPATIVTEVVMDLPTPPPRDFLFA